MTSALIGIGLILLIALITAVLGTVTRLLAGGIDGPDASRGAPLTLTERIARGDERIARDLRPDETHPVARTAERDATTRAVAAFGPDSRQELAVRHPEIVVPTLR
ncbi:hypothetical protein ACFQRD_15440 [Brachybacterium sp. GCM10030268]|uniref:hypothetical protein n=1 Tax=Brachybacterium sp. GCM10030268 TaxID=3273382 RepID=UPI00360FCB18